MRNSTETLIVAMRILSQDIQSEDGVVSAATAEAAQRLAEQQERIKRLEEAGDEMYRWITVKRLCSIDCTEAWNKAKEAKAVSEYEHNEHLLDEIDRLRESNFHLRKGCEELKHRIAQLEQENDAMRADLLLWNKAGIGFTTEDKP